MLMTTIPTNAGPGPAQAATPSIVAAVFTGGMAAVIIIASLLSHLGVVGHPDAFIDELTLGAFVVIFGFVPNLATRGQVAANTAAVMAAHQRLDAVHAPPAADGALTAL